MEKNIAARIRGRGPYEGVSSVDANAFAAKRSRVSEDAISDAVDYDKAYGLPLLVNDPSKRPNGGVFAVSTGLGNPFRIVCFEELEQRGPRRLHWEWTRDMIHAGRIPNGYASEFSQHDADDVLCYLNELEENELDFQMYARVYFGQSLLSQQKTAMFLDEEIDLSATDFDPWSLGWKPSGDERSFQLPAGRPLATGRNGGNPSSCRRAGHWLPAETEGILPADSGPAIGYRLKRRESFQLTAGRPLAAG